VKNVALHNLGCKVNGYELDVIKQKLVEEGYNICPFESSADVYIINTCTVTNIADRKSRQMLHKAKKENKDAIVIAIGCYVDTNKEKIEMDDCIDIAIGNNRKAELVDILKKYEKEKDLESLEGDGIKCKKTYLDESIDVKSKEKTVIEEMELKSAPEHTRAYIKIQDGCNQFCSYCLIPYARGRVRSREQKDIVNEIINLARGGVKEVVITGIHISSFGIDRGESELISLLKKVHAIKGIERIRLGSLEPRIITKENAKAFASMPKLCPHFHLSLQSGCEETLKRMNRHYSAKEYMEGVEILRSVYDRPAITTDVIVGFPGETEEEFEESRKFCEDVNFYEMHVFKYSVRKGTAAEKMPMQLTDRQKAQRSDVLIEMSSKNAKKYRESFIGERVNVLWENSMELDGKTYMIGHTEKYVKIGKEIDKSLEKELSGTFEEGVCKGFLNDEILIID